MISVVIPCYNYAEFLPYTIDSLLNQTYQQWECILINDGSTDNTEQVCREYGDKDPRIKYFYKENGGLSSARNEGLRLAEGHFIQFLDADDLLDPHKFEVQIRFFEQDPSLSICYSDFVFLDHLSGKTMEKEKVSRMRIAGDAYEDFLYNWVKGGLIIPIHCPLIRRSFLTENAIVFDERVRAIEDWLFWLDVSKKKPLFLFVDRPYAIYRKHDLSMVHDKKKMLKDYLIAIFYIYNNLELKYREAFVARYADILSNEFEAERVKNLNLKGSLAYKTGKAILSPLSKIKNILKRKG